MGQDLHAGPTLDGVPLADAQCEECMLTKLEEPSVCERGSGRVLCNHCAWSCIRPPSSPAGASCPAQAVTPSPDHQKAKGVAPGLAGDAATRKGSPMAEGLLHYFPNALAAVAAVSRVGNEQHNPGQPLHWSFDKSTDEADCILRHLADRGTLDTSGVEAVRHSAKVAWRALAMLERELLAAHPELQPGRNVWNFERGGA